MLSLNLLYKGVSTKMPQHFKGDQDELESITSVISKEACRQDLDKLLNGFMIIQAQHNKIRVEEVKGLELDPDTMDPVMKTAKDRELLWNTLPKHIKDIFIELQTHLTDADFMLFMEYLLGNIKNLAVRIQLQDKKQEKALLQSLEKELEAGQDENLLCKLSYVLY